MSRTSRMFKHRGKPKQKTQKHISEDELDAITSVPLGNDETMRRTNASAVFVHCKNECSRCINFWNMFVGGWLSGSKSIFSDERRYQLTLGRGPSR